MLSDELQRLEQMRASGQLSEEEFQQAKQRVLNEPSGGQSVAGDGRIHDMEPNTWCMLMHLSQFAGYLTGGLGLVAPIVMWLMSKDQSPQADRQGKIIVNWLISCLIYTVISAILLLVLIGIPMLIVLAVLGIVFPIIGAMKANEGVEWKYPLSIEFLRLDSYAGTGDPNWHPQQ